MAIFREIEEIRQFVLRQQANNKRVALVATMGGLHEGHFALVKHAKMLADRVIVSIFVNPKQFGENEDYDHYPGNIGEDCALLQPYEVDAIFIPQAEQIYPLKPGFHITAPPVANTLCGKSRPQFFHGIALAVSKLFIIMPVDLALFGEKDYQQLFILRQLVRDLHFDIEIAAVPTVRAEDGLAHSTRNRYLSANQRQIAPEFYRTLRWAKQQIDAGDAHQSVRNQAIARLQQNFTVDYFEILDQQTLLPCAQKCDNIRILSAVYLDKTRLIDNIKI